MSDHWSDPHAPAGEPIRLRTLVVLRWVAILGQLGAVAVAHLLGLRFDNVAVLAVIGLSAVLNLILGWRNWPVDSRHVTLQLAFDVFQVAILLILTGGLTNPFALLLLGPVTVAATALSRRSVLFLSLSTVAMVTLAGLVSVPLRNADGSVLAMQGLLEVGHWVALVISVGFFAAYAHRVASELRARSTALSAAEMALAREQKLHHLGGVVAAAAHEMGTPLATIKLVASELADELASEFAGRPGLAEDIQLLHQSADRCRDILRSMGEAGKDDLLLRAAPLEALLDEAAGPHAGRARIDTRLNALDESPAPVVRRDPGVIHGLRNVIQNAVDFSTAEVRIDATWTRSRVRVIIADDGPGYPPAMLARIGEPFLTRRRGAETRPGYEGMGLGLFIAKTLLQRSGATLTFRNGDPGAIVEISWPRARIEAEGGGRGALGDNPAISG